MNRTRTPQILASESIAPKILYFGTPVALITTLKEDGAPNIGPISSVWALGWTLLLGLESTAKTTANLRRQPECVVNLVSEDLCQKVEKLAPLTGNNPVPKHKAEQFRYEPDKFAAVGLTPLASEEINLRPSSGISLKSAPRTNGFAREQLPSKSKSFGSTSRRK
jgi:flavin reductase (DIM6/NTAB) family NADH-FMN oxidoreductase RutF